MFEKGFTENIETRKYNLNKCTLLVHIYWLNLWFCCVCGPVKVKISNYSFLKSHRTLLLFQQCIFDRTVATIIIFASKSSIKKFSYQHEIHWS